MSNRFFNNTQDLLPITRARATAVEANLDAVGSGFDLAEIELDASLRAPDGETLNRLPNAAGRQNKALNFNATGQTAVADVASQAEMQAAVDAAAAAAQHLADTEDVYDDTVVIKNQAQAILDDFEGRYLGASASDPTVDANGAAVGLGDLYYNTTLGRFKVHSGSGWTVAVDTQVVYTTVNSNITASPGDFLAIDTTASRTINLPSSPTAQTQVSFKDASGNAHLMPFTVGRNGQTIEDIAEDMICNTRYAAFMMKFINGSWRIL